MSERTAVAFCVHDDHWFLKAAIGSWIKAGPVFVFVSKRAWNGEAGNWKRASKIAKAAGANVVLGDWPDENLHRRSSHQAMIERGHPLVFTPDGDEIVEARLLESLLALARAGVADRVHVHMDTYWKSPEYVIRPREQLAPIIFADLRVVRHVNIRDFEGGRPIVLGPEFGVLHHLSYAGPDERIQKKVRSWGHRNEVIEDWYTRSWIGWDRNKLLRDLHPTHPTAYGFTERIAIPPELAGLMGQPDERLSSNGKQGLAKRPSVSVVIPVHGGEDDTRDCLQSLERCRDLFDEVLVIDNASPDSAATVAAEFSFVRVIPNDENRGFAAACNQGITESTGEIVLLLNNDTLVPKVGLEALIRTLLSSGSIAAAGPLTNKCGHSQQLEPTYTDLANLDRFAEDFASRDVDDYEAPADMLVGFCLAIRRSVLDEVGGFDESFGLGTFEDNDLCYRMRRAGYRLMIAARAFVHHHGSQTLRRIVRDPWRILRENEEKFRSKWREDLDLGYATHLSGTKDGQIRFDPERHPDRLRAIAKERGRQADISLCMIVRDEERVIGDCLRSARPFFSQMIVVDTGSTDRTKEIAMELGAEVYEFPWPDSFSEARNESLQHAKGRWVFWMDADDTLPFPCGEALQHAAIGAPRQVGAFVVPVQFVEEGPGAGTRVDHVKLFRNDPRVQFEFRIHEQNLASLRAIGVEISRCPAYVLHSGYDASPEGQAKKRERDLRLLNLDLAERPDHPFVLFNMGMTEHFAGEHHAAIRWLERSIRLADPVESHVRKAYALLAGSQRALGLSGEAISTCLRGLQAVASDPELHFTAAQLYASMDRLQEAEHHYLAMPLEIEGQFSSVDIGILTFKRLHNLADVRARAGNYLGAREAWLAALQAAPNHEVSASALFETALNCGDYATARAMFEHVRRHNGPSIIWAEMGSKLFSAFGGSFEGETFLERETSANPYCVGPRLLLARNLLNANRVSEAIAHLDALDQMGCAEAAFYLGLVSLRQSASEIALQWFQRADHLEPNHRQTLRYIETLRAMTPKQVPA